MNATSRKILVFLCLAGGCVLLVHPYFEGTRNANERPRLIQILALAEEGEFRIDGPSRRGLQVGPDVSRHPATGVLYPNKPPGASIFALPAVGVSSALGENWTLSSLTWWARFFTAMLPSLALLGVFLVSTPRQLLPGAFFASLVLLFATPVASYSRLFYGHQLAGFFFAVGSVLVIRGFRLNTARICFLGGMGCGLAVTVEYGIAFAGVPLAAYAVWKGAQKSLAPLAWAIGGFLIPTVALLAYHNLAFGSPWETGYHHVINPEFIEKHGQGFLGLSTPRWESFYTHFIAPSSGLLPLAPAVILGVVGLWREARTGEYAVEARIFLVAVGVMVLVGSSLRFDGGWRVGPRYLVSTLPVLLLGWRNWFHTTRGFLALGGGFALVSFSLILNHSLALLWPHLNVEPIAFPWRDIVVPLYAAECLTTPLIGFKTIAWHILFLLPVGMLLWVITFSSQRNGKAFAVGIVLSLAALWASPSSDSEQAQRNMRYIQSMHTCGEEPAPNSVTLDSHSASSGGTRQ